MPLSPTSDAIGGHEPRQALRCRERRLEGFQIAIVDTDQPGFQAQRAVQFLLVVHLDQHVHSKRNGCAFELPRAGVVNGGHDDQDAIGTGGARFGHLVRIVHEVLAQNRQRAGCPRDAQMLERP